MYRTWLDYRDPAGASEEASETMGLPATGISPEEMELDLIPARPQAPGEACLVSRAVDCDIRHDRFLEEVTAGLLATPKQLPCKYLYDERGSELFNQICALPEYYPTRKELEILRRHADDIASAAGPFCEVIEYGSGSSTKTRILLNHLKSPLAYFPIDICGEQLFKSCDALRAAYPDLKVQPICVDYTEPLDLPDPPMVRGQWEAAGIMRTARRLAFFPGSTIGNFSPDEAVNFLRRIGKAVGPGGALLIGVDLKKDASILEPAYDDAAGVTAQFNMNLLARLNREMDADFDLSAWQHSAFYNPVFGRMEMHLVSLREQTVHLNGHAISFEKGETIWTESSYKYTLLGFSAVAARAGFHVERVWTDDDKHFSVQFLVQDAE